MERRRDGSGTSGMEMESKGQKGEGKGEGETSGEKSLCARRTFDGRGPRGWHSVTFNPPVATLSFLPIQITGTVALEGRKREKEKARERRSGGDDGGGDGNGGTRLLDRGGRADRG